MRIANQTPEEQVVNLTEKIQKQSDLHAEETNRLREHIRKLEAEKMGRAASETADSAFADYELVPITPGNNCSRYDGLEHDGSFVFHEAIGFRDDNGYDASQLYDRAIASINRALGPDSMGRVGPGCSSLPPFEPGRALEIIVRVL